MSALFVFVLMLLPAVPASQEKPGKEEGEDERLELVEHAEVELSLLEVVVLDKRGHHVRGLPSSAFRIMERKREIPISTFDEIDLSSPDRKIIEQPAEERQQPEAVTEMSIETPTVDSAITSVAESRYNRPRWFVLLFDGYNNPSPLRINHVRKAAKDWVLKNLSPTDRAAVFELTPYLMSVTGFTDDPITLRQSIDKVRVFPGSDMGEQLLEDRLTQTHSTTEEFLESRLRNAGEFANELLAQERDQFYISIYDVSRMLAGLEGTKAIILFSGGFPITMNRATNASGGFTVRFKRMLQEIQNQGVRVYTFDVGEEGVFTDASEATNLRVAVEELGLGAEWLDNLQIGAQIDSVNAHHEILSVLGTESGGRFIRGRDYRGGLDAVNDDLNHYYLVGYDPGETRQTVRGYIPLKVKLNDPKLRAVARKGRFLDTAQPVAGEIEETRSDSQAVTEQKDETPDEIVPKDLRLFCKPLFYPGPDGKTLAVLPVRVDGPVEAVRIAPGKLILDITLDISVSAGGEEIAGGDRHIRAGLKADARERLTRGFMLRDAIVLPPAALEFAIEVKLHGQDRSGSWRQVVAVPEMRTGRFDLSDPALLSPTEKALQVYDVFKDGEPVLGTGDGRTIVDPLGTDAAHRPPHLVETGHSGKVPLLVQVSVVSPPMPLPDGSSPLRMDWELYPAGGGEAVAPPIRYRKLQMAPDGSLLDIVVDMELSELPLGDYTLRLTAENLTTGERRVRTVPLTLSP